MNISKRIDEIFQEQQIDLKPFAESIGISRDILRNIVKGRKSQKAEGEIEYRVPMQSDLQKIADGLKISVSRLTGKDVEKPEAELKSLIQSGYFPEKAFEIAAELHSKALGIEEGMRFNWYMGQTLTNLNRMNEAEFHLQQAYGFAKRTGNFELARRSAILICNHYHDSKQYTLMCEKTKDFEDYFKEDKRFIGKLETLRGLCAFYKNDLTTANKHYDLALSIYKEIGDSINQGRLLMNKAEVCYQVKDLINAKELLQQAKDLTENDNARIKLTVKKDLARISVILGQKETALQIVEESLREIEAKSLRLSELHSKFLLMKSQLLDTDEWAKIVFKLDGVDKEILAIASKFLGVYYYERGDYHKSVNFHMKLENCMQFNLRNITEL